MNIEPQFGHGIQNRFGEFYSADDFCRLFNFSYRTFLRYVKDGTLKAYKVRRKYRINAIDIENLLHASAIVPEVSPKEDKALNIEEPASTV